MGDEVRLRRIDIGETLNELPRSSLDLEARLQAWLERDISVLASDLLVVGREVPTDFGGSIDLLGVDAAGNSVRGRLVAEFLSARLGPDLLSSTGDARGR